MGHRSIGLFGTEGRVRRRTWTSCGCVTVTRTSREHDVAEAEPALSAMDLKKAYYAQSRMRRGRDLSGKARK